MEFTDFERLLREMCAEIPREYFDGITEIVASPRVRPHPENAEVFTLGECIPLAVGGGEGEAVQSRIVLYHGSFRAVAEDDPAFDWEGEAWETLTHELRHHLEWRAQQDDLGELDDVMEANFRRQSGESFDPTFFLGGIRHPHGWYEVGEDWFRDGLADESRTVVDFAWGGERYEVAVPRPLSIPAYLVVESGVPDPPGGELVVVMRRRPRMRDLFLTGTAPTRYPVTAQHCPSEVVHGL